MAQIINEKDMLSKMNHPSIVKLYFTFQDPTWLYLALELCPNGELAELIARKGRLPLDLVKFYTGELVNILSYLRQLGVAHRDIKPENLFISDTGHLKLGDFDTAKVVIAGSNTSHANHEKRTERMNTFVGTAQYVSPEMLHDSAVAGFGSDLWALGCVVFQMLTGSPPFKSNSEYVTFQKILATDYAFPAEVPPVGKSFVKALLTLEPQDRLGFFDVDDLKKHPLLKDVNVVSLPDQDPPLEGVLRLKKRRVRMTSEDVDSSDEENFFFSDSSSDLEGEDFGSQFNGIAPQSPSLLRCATTAPVTTNAEPEADQTARVSPSGELFRATPMASAAGASGLFKKAESSPALLALNMNRSRSCSNLQMTIEESSVSGSPRRASSMASGTSAEAPGGLSPTSSVMIMQPPPMAIKSWASNRNLSSKPSVIVESLMARQAMEMEVSGMSPAEKVSVSGVESIPALEAASPTAASTAALTNYLQRICASDEHILMSGYVLKRRFFGKPRILVVTDLPRLLVLDPKNFKVVCEIPLLSAPAAANPTAELLSEEGTLSSNQSVHQAGTAITFLSATEFSIETESTYWRGEVRDGTAQAWVSLIHAMKQKAVKAASSRPPRPFQRVVSPQEANTIKILERPNFKSMDIMGSLYARGGVSSDLPSQEELEAVAQARVEAALKQLGGSSGNVTPDVVIAAIEKQRSTERDDDKASDAPSDDPYKIEIDDAVFSSIRRGRRRENSSSCRLM